ncbi:MAG: hypothetical protein C0622_06630 [Desulfuromonas sp.]|nr:MAG: hypothetical protein C0622_06630 [Desulfuromonas sp.]
MALRDDLKPTGRKGIFFKEHETRRHGVKRDRLLILRYTIAGQTRTESFGWLSEGLTELDAERKLAAFRANAKKGSGPTSLTEERELKEQAELEAEEAAKLAAERERTFSDLAAEYLDGLTVRPTTARFYRDCLEIAAAYKPAKGKPTLGETLIFEIPKKYLAQCIEYVSKKRSASLAVAVRSSLSAFYTWLSHPGREYVEVNPVPAIPKPKANTPRERTLTDTEIVTVWHNLDDGDTLHRLLKFLLLTGVRLSEAINLDRREIDETNNWWTIPGSRTKSKRPHRVYLTESARALLIEERYPFFNVVVKDGKQKRQALSAQALNHNLRRNDFYGVEKFCAHDLRRTIASGLALRGTTSDHIAAVLSHKLHGVTAAHYLRHNQDDEKKRAWLAWERHVLSITGKEKTTKVIPLDSRR